MMSIFFGMVEDTLEVLMDYFSVVVDFLIGAWIILAEVLKRCEDRNFLLNWVKCHFMGKDYVVLGYQISK